MGWTFFGVESLEMESFAGSTRSNSGKWRGSVASKRSARGGRAGETSGSGRGASGGSMGPSTKPVAPKIDEKQAAKSVARLKRMGEILQESG